MLETPKASVPKNVKISAKKMTCGKTERSRKQHELIDRKPGNRGVFGVKNKFTPSCFWGAARQKLRIENRVAFYRVGPDKSYIEFPKYRLFLHLKWFFIWFRLAPDMQPFSKYVAIPVLALATMAGLNIQAQAAEGACYECAAKLCYDEFTTAASAIDQQFVLERTDVERHLSEMQLEAAKKAEVLGATEDVLRDNAGQRKQIAFDGLRQCLTAD